MSLLRYRDNTKDGTIFIIAIIISFFCFITITSCFINIKTHRTVLLLIIAIIKMFFRFIAIVFPTIFCFGYSSPPIGDDNEESQWKNYFSVEQNFYYRDKAILVGLFLYYNLPVGLNNDSLRKYNMQGQTYCPDEPTNIVLSREYA